MTLQAFHNNEEIKSKYLNRVKAHAVADESVELVRKFFKKLRYQTTTKNKPTANGPDLVIIKNERSYTIEVKTAYFTARSWQIGKTHNFTNDFIAMVLPGNVIHIEEMDSHRGLCTVYGKRSVTSLVRLLCD